MNKINFFLAFCCLVAALSLQFKKPDYVVSADEVKAYSKSFVPGKKIGTSFSCCTMNFLRHVEIVGSGHYCTTGTITCTDKPCKEGGPCEAE